MEYQPKHCNRYLNLTSVRGKSGQFVYIKITSYAAGVDYQAASGILRFDPGDSQGTVTISIFDDSISDADQTFFVDLRDLSNNFCDTTEVVIVDDEPEGML